MTQPTDIDPSVLAQSVLGLLMRSGRPRSEGLGKTMEVEHESGEAMTFTMLASKSSARADFRRSHRGSPCMVMPSRPRGSMTCPAATSSASASSYR